VFVWVPGLRTAYQASAHAHGRQELQHESERMAPRQSGEHSMPDVQPQDGQMRSQDGKQVGVRQGDPFPLSGGSTGSQKKPRFR
jgi:hypothetical protein